MEPAAMTPLSMRLASTLAPTATAAKGWSRWAPVVITAVLAFSCTRDRGIQLPSGPACPTSGIRGRVEVAGRGVAASLSVASVGSPASEIRLGADSDSLGRFLFPLEAGSYLLRMGSAWTPSCTWSEGAPAGNYDSAGVVVVEDGKVTRTDFAFGEVVVHLTLPRQFDGEYAQVILARRPGGPQSQRYLCPGGKVESGEVTLHSNGIPAGVYSMVLQPLTPGTPDILLPGVLDPRRADSVVVRAGATTGYESALAYSTSVIRGEIRGSWESAGYASRPLVTFLTEDSLVIGSVETDAHGDFSAELAYARRIRVAVSIGYVRQWIGGRGFREATTFTLEPGRETETPLFTESGLLVRLVPPDPWMGVAAVCELFDEQGRVTRAGNGPAAPDQFIISNLIPGSYRLLVTPGTWGDVDWQPQWFDHAGSAERAQAVGVPVDGAIGSVVIHLERAGEIRGVVRNVSGAPLSYHTVMVTRADSIHAWAIRRSGASGRFRVRGLPDGAWKIGVSEEAGPSGDPGGVGDYTWIWFGGASFDSAAVIAIRDHILVDGIEIRLP